MKMSSNQLRSVEGPLYIHVKGVQSELLLSDVYRHVNFEMTGDGRLLLDNEEPSIAAQHIMFSGSSQPLYIRTASGSNGNVKLLPDGLGAVQLQSGSLETDSQLIAHGALTVKGASSAASQDVVIGPEDSSVDFSLMIVSDATNIVVSGSNDSNSLRMVGTGSSPYLHLSTGSGTVIVSSDSTNVTLSSESSLSISGGTGGDVILESGSGTVYIAGNQDVSGEVTSNVLRLQGFTAPSATQAPMSLGSISSSVDMFVEIVSSYSADGSAAYGLSSVSGKSLTLSTKSDNYDIIFQPNGDGAVVIDDILQLPVMSLQTICASDLSEDGKLWMYKDVVYVCIGSSSKQMVFQ